jgi:hypothetical protein
VFVLFLVVLVIGMVAALLLAAWALWFQAQIYSEPAQGIHWRAPAAGGALVLFLGLWVLLDYRSPGSFRELHDFTAVEILEYPEMKVPTQLGEELYVLRPNARGIEEYRRRQPPGNDRLPQRPPTLIVYENEGKPAPFSANGQAITFKPDRKENGAFQTGEDGLLRYRDDRGRSMVENRLGQVRIFHVSWLLANLLINLLHLVVWFLVLWLLMEFQWGHALLQAMVIWLIATFFMIPPLLERAEQTARARPAESQARARSTELVPSLFSSHPAE